MTLQQSKDEDTLECSHCENLGEISLAGLQRQQQKTPVKIWVRNLPEGILESGLKNLFLTVGEPLSILYNARSKCALVEFKQMNEVELAIRDLNCKPPYNLKVTLAFQKPKYEAHTNHHNAREKLQDMFVNVAPLGALKNSSQKGYHEGNGNVQLNGIINQVEQQIKSVIENIGFDPSLRMRQKKLDFRTNSNCVSKGRGYLYMGDKDRFIGGLEKFEFSSEKSKAKDKMSFSCENCKALTTKICGDCSASFCSNDCMIRSADKHQDSCLKWCADEKYAPGDGLIAKKSPKHTFQTVWLKSGCTVVMASYFTTQTVFVRPCDHPWEEEFNKLCNDVAVEALKGTKFKQNLRLGDMVIARYQEDLSFYRAQVIDVGRDEVLVFFIDFGNTQDTRPEDLLPLPPHLNSLPSFAVKVQLKNVPMLSSIDLVNYYNKLTAERTPLVMKFDKSIDEVVLIEKDSKTNVNEAASKLSRPSWKMDNSAFRKTGEVFYLGSMRTHRLQIGETYTTLKVSHIEEEEFLDSEVFWMVHEGTEEAFHAQTEMLLRMTQYCEFLKDDCYLPRANELCLARENGRWHRCVNLKSQKTTCCLLFLDSGHSSSVCTSNIRKMVQDFTELPSQAVCCTLPDYPKLKDKKMFQARALDYLKKAVGQPLDSVHVLKMSGDAYCLSFPEMSSLAAAIQRGTISD